MSKPIDQEREAFETWFAREVAVKVSCGNPDILRRQYWPVWQARAAVQPAGVAVPDAVEVAAYITRPSRMTMDGWEDGYEYAVIASEASEADKRYDVPLMTVAQHNHIVAMLAVAPHPVSGEQKPIQRRYPDWGLVRQSSSAISIVQGATYVTFREGEDDKRMPWLVDFLSSLLAGNDPSPRAEQDMFELRLCEQKHTVLKPGVAYLFTVDPNCAACVELDSAPPASQDVARLVEALESKFPRIDITKPLPLDEKAHCCEHTIYVERERLHRLIAAHRAQQGEQS